jgi:hypothetical protein
MNFQTLSIDFQLVTVPREDVRKLIDKSFQSDFEVPLLPVKKLTGKKMMLILV